MHFVQVGIPPAREGAQQVLDSGGLEIPCFHPCRVGNTGFRGEFRPVDDVPPVGWQADTIYRFHIGRARFGELASHTTELDDRHLGPKGEHHGHLQQHTEGVAHNIGLELAKAFSARAALKHKGLALCSLSQMVAQAAHFTSKNQRRVGAQPVLNVFKGCCVRIGGNLLERKRTPAIRHPGLRRRVGLGERSTHNAFLFSWADYTQMVSRWVKTISLGHEFAKGGCLYV